MSACVKIMREMAMNDATQNKRDAIHKYSQASSPLNSSRYAKYNQNKNDSIQKAADKEAMWVTLRSKNKSLGHTTGMKARYHTKYCAVSTLFA